ncbi:MAG: hypothetical protein ACQETH_15145 [Candidatus Rifleibacteriota bacterium]
MQFNPQSIQKQARKWPVSFYSRNFVDDLKSRIQQIWQPNIELFNDPFQIELAVNGDLIGEYGIDCCRLAQIEAQNSDISISLLESAYKWLNKFTQQLYKQNKEKSFKPAVWLEAALEAKDHLLNRNKPHSGLATIKNAFKTTPICNGMSSKDLQLVLSCLYPFIPITVGYYNKTFFSNFMPQTILSIFDYYPDLIMIHYCIGNGGWHWTVLKKKQFEAAPMESLKTIKQVKLATKNKNACLKKVSQGYLICLN